MSCRCSRGRSWRSWPRVRRSWRRARAAEQRRLVEEPRALILETQRDAALRRTEIAGELHDSIGHGLATIIALSQGLAVKLEGRCEDPVVGESLAALTSVARESLEDTRAALRGLTATDAELAERTTGPRETVVRRSWEDIRPVLEHARASGVVTTFIETGRRAQGSAQADLCFRVTREAVKNALRHAHELGHLAIAWEHAADGSMTLSVRDDGRGEGDIEGGGVGGDLADTDAVGTTGTGLSRLQREVRALGGSFSFGPPDDGVVGWRVMARIPGGRTVGEGQETGAPSEPDVSTGEDDG